MLSTDLPITEYWDPEWDVYEVPLSPFNGPGSQLEVPYEIWWAAYEHDWVLGWILDGTAWYAPHHWQNQLTTGHCRDDGPPYLGAWPWPCTCEYFVFDCPWPARWAIASGFRIHSDCPQHGDDALC